MDNLQQAINDNYTRKLIQDNNIDTKIAKFIYKLYGDDSFDRLSNETNNINSIEQNSQTNANDEYTKQLIKDNNIDTKIARFIYSLYGDDSFDRLQNMGE